MGLDMYLHKVKKEEIAYWRKANQINKWFADHVAGGNLENCEGYPVTKEQLEELKETCEKVLNYCSSTTVKDVPAKKYDSNLQEYVNTEVTKEVIEDSSLAEELLPTESGFFYGSTDYDEWYIEDLKNTVEQIGNILNTVDFDEYDIEYHAWW